MEALYRTCDRPFSVGWGIQSVFHQPRWYQCENSVAAGSQEMSEYSEDMLTRLVVQGESMESDLQEIKGLLKNSYVTKEEFAPVKNAVYGLIGSAVLGVLGALIRLVVK